MGNNLAYDLAESDLSLEQSITIQLRNNHYPPVPYEMVPVCIEAINAYNNGDYDQEIKLPMINDFQVTFRGRDTSPANEIVFQHHLGNWVSDNDWE
jgi:hypothetical protein